MFANCLRVENGTVRGDSTRRHAVDNLLRHLGVGDDEDGLGVGLVDELVHLPDDVGVSPLVGVPDDGVGVGTPDLSHDTGAVCGDGLPGAPEDTAGCDVGEEERQARANAGSSCDDDNSLEELGGIEKTVEGSTADP